MADKPTLTQRWQSIPPKKRAIYAGGTVVVAVLLAGVMTTPSQPNLVAGSKGKPVTTTPLALPGGNNNLALEKLSATMEAVKTDQNQLRNDQKAFQQQVAAKVNQPTAATQADPATVEELRQLRSKVEQLETERNNTKEPSLDDALPTGNVSQQALNSHATVPEREAPRLRVLGNAKEEDKSEESVDKPKQIVFMPAGSNYEGVLMNGMDAPTSSVAQKNPVPALIRVKTDAILPNRYRYDVRECFVIVSGFGVLSTERAQLQTVTLSCVKADGGVIESKLEGYIVGEDGKVGLRGRLVTKQGQLLAKSFVAGFASGIGAAMTPMAVPQLNTTPGSNTQYQTPNINQIATAGTAQGISQSARSLSQFYLDMAKEMFPVIEIDANRRVTIVLVKGIELKLNGDKQ